MNFNLLDQLTKEDRKKIENYIYLYGTKNNFIGLDNWLKYWSINKIKMYKLLGNQLIYHTNFEYNKSQSELDKQVINLVESSSFVPKFKNWLYDNDEILPPTVKIVMSNCCSRFTLILDTVGESFKFKMIGCNKTLQIQKDMKPLRAIGRFLDYCKDLEGADELIKSFEEFRIAHSMILNDKIVKGKLAISIHPLDFMTMSDNNSNWQSCMSWKDNGCYHEGTIEMMNSNNVLCCYIENNEPYYFSPKRENKNQDCSEEYKWHNKKWRQLVYFTKDIIVSGKPYPYSNDEISKTIIEIIRDLARKNLHWTYSFGPEEYKDMQYINSSFSMNRARNYIQWGNMTKHNILFDTKGMYNDMLNDSSTKYWCVRNKVKHNKIISYSGKAPCLCCGAPIIEESYDNYDYNERYTNCNSSVCNDCLIEMRCNFCDQEDPREIHHKIILENGKEVSICSSCVRDYLRKCPDCGKTMFVTGLFGRWNIFTDEDLDSSEVYIKLQEEINKEELTHGFYSSNPEKINERFSTLYPICRCKNCAEKDKSFELQTITYGGHLWTERTGDFLISKEIQKKEDWEKYFAYNLEPVTICEGEIITN